MERINTGGEFVDGHRAILMMRPMTIEQLSEQLKTLHNDLIRSNPPQIMTSREAAQFLSVTDETMFRWRKDGVGPSYSQPNPRVVRYLHGDLVAWMKEHQA